MKVDEYLLKKPFTRISPLANSLGGYAFSGGEKIAMPNPAAQYYIVSQDDFLREYDINGHKIWDENFYANRLKSDDNGRTYIHYVERMATNWQEIIVNKQCLHLCTNPIEFTVVNSDVTDANELALETFSQGWEKKNMHVAWTQVVKEAKICGDAAVCFYMDEGQIGWKIMTYRNSETLYPQYDRKTGKLSEFARRYKQYDDTGENLLAEYVDIWDKTYYRQYKRTNSFWTKTKRLFGADGWELIGSGSHGFPFIPVCYKREEFGACWSNVQSAIDEYELSTSSLLENNKMTAFRTLFIKGDMIDPQFDKGGNVNMIVGDKDAEAKWLEKADVADGFKMALENLERNIINGSFIVIPPEVKGSDVSGTTIKLLYSPAIEKATMDAFDWNLFMDDMVRCFKYGYGIEISKSMEFNVLDIVGKIVPFVQQSTLELVTMLGTSVQAGTLSRKTAARKNPLGVNYEYQRVEAEKKEGLFDKGGGGVNAAQQAAAGTNVHNNAEQLAAQ